MKSYNVPYGSNFTLTIKNIYKAAGVRVTDAPTDVTEAGFIIKSALSDTDAAAKVSFTVANTRMTKSGAIVTCAMVASDYSSIVPNRVYHAAMSLTFAQKVIIGKFTFYFEDTAFDA